MLVEFFCQIRKVQDRNFKNKRNDIEYSAKLRCEVVVATLILSKLAIQIKASLSATWRFFASFRLLYGHNRLA